MRRSSRTRLSPPVKPGESLLTKDPIGLIVPPVMKMLDGNTVTSIFTVLENQQQELEDAVTAALEHEDYKALSQWLEFLKFDQDSVGKIVDIVATAAGLVSVIGAVVSVFETARKLSDLLGIVDSHDFGLEATVLEISANVKQLYGCLEQAQRNGLSKEANVWRTLVDQFDEREGDARVRVHIEFRPLAGNNDAAHPAKVAVTLTPLTVDFQPDAFLIYMDVPAMHESDASEREQSPQPQDVVVQGLSVRVIPSYLVVDSDFFDAYWDVMHRMLTAMVRTQLRVRFGPDAPNVPHAPNPDPEIVTVNGSPSNHTSDKEKEKPPDEEASRAEQRVL